MDTQKLIQDLRLIAKTEIALKYPNMDVKDHICYQAAEKIEELDNMLLEAMERTDNFLSNDE